MALVVALGVFAIVMLGGGMNRPLTAPAVAMNPPPPAQG